MKKLVFIFCLFIFCIGITASVDLIPDLDLWARLIAGAHIIEKGFILKNDIFSYTPTHIWYDHEWGASVFFYLALKYFGANGLIFLKGILVALTLFVCFKTVELNKPKSTVPYNIIYYAVMFLIGYKLLGSVVRCLLFTCLFFAIELYILERSRKGSKKILFIIPFMMVLWSNIHGGCISGLGLLVIYIIGEFLNQKSIKEYIYTLIASIFAVFINPYGIEYVKFLFSAASMERRYITEWASPFRSGNIFLGYTKFKIYLIFLWISQILYFIKIKPKYSNIDKTKILLLLLVTYLSVTHIRHILFFIFTAGTLLYEEFYTIFNNILYKLRKFCKIENKEFIKSFCLIKEIFVYFFLFIVSFPFIISNEKQIKITETEYPRYAIEFIKLNNIKGNLFINFDWGSYAAYKLYPNNLIVMDGRYEEVYYPDLLKQLKNFHLVENDWYKIIRDYKTDVMVLENKFPVYPKILEDERWSLVFENNLFGVFVPAEKAAQNYILPIPDDDYYNKTLFDTDIDFFNKV